MLIALLMAVHVGAFCAWVSAATAEALLAESGAKERALLLSRRWAPSCMTLCLVSGGAAMALAYPFYRGQAWLWMKIAAALAAASVTSLRALGCLSPRPALGALAVASTLALALSFARLF